MWLFVVGSVLSIVQYIYESAQLKEYEGVYLSRCSESIDFVQCQLIMDEHSHDCMAKKRNSKMFGQGLKIYQRCMDMKANSN